jgi:single-stranded-DNA-specific exonuclease
VVAARESEASVGLARALGVPEPIARLLICRGLETVEAAEGFLRPGLGQLHDPYLMLGMEGCGGAAAGGAGEARAGADLWGL